MIPLDVRGFRRVFIVLLLLKVVVNRASAQLELERYEKKHRSLKPRRRLKPGLS